MLEYLISTSFLAGVVFGVLSFVPLAQKEVKEAGLVFLFALVCLLCSFVLLNL